MRTKIIPFDLEMAKKIQAGEIGGKIKTRDGKHTMRIVCYDSTAKFHGETQEIIAQDTEDCSDLRAYFKNGNYVTFGGRIEDLVLEVPDNEPQFKPFDKVLVRNKSNERWQPRLYEMYSGGTEKHYCQDGQGYLQCIPYEGNEHLVGTTNNPKED